ncbi:unnamed protein product [Sphagnum jensenii]|uniref:Uncharacterized protein n=1 Tax=Sphagnum jensenii TaxID=128206 RepID=A0ABP0VEN4_9BRYO
MFDTVFFNYCDYVIRNYDDIEFVSEDLPRELNNVNSDFYVFYKNQMGDAAPRHVKQSNHYQYTELNHSRADPTTYVIGDGYLTSVSNAGSGVCARPVGQNSCDLRKDSQYKNNKYSSTDDILAEWDRNSGRQYVMRDDTHAMTGDKHMFFVEKDNNMQTAKSSIKKSTARNIDKKDTNNAEPFTNRACKSGSDAQTTNLGPPAPSAPSVQYYASESAEEYLDYGRFCLLGSDYTQKLNSRDLFVGQPGFGREDNESMRRLAGGMSRRAVAKGKESTAIPFRKNEFGVVNGVRAGEVSLTKRRVDYKQTGETLGGGEYETGATYGYDMSGLKARSAGIQQKKYGLF